MFSSLFSGLGCYHYLGYFLALGYSFNNDIKAKCHYSEEFQKTSYVELDKWIDEELIPAINRKMENHPFEAIETESNFSDKIKEQSKAEEIDDLPFLVA